MARTPRGIRDKVPSRHLIGRSSSGEGAAEYIPYEELVTVVRSGLPPAVSDAADVTFTPYDHITSTNVQDAIEEVVDEFVSRIKTSTQFMAGELHISPASGSPAFFGTNSEGLVGSGLFSQNFRSSVDPPSVVLRHTRGTRLSPTVLLLNDRVFTFLGQGYDGTTNRDGFSMHGRVIAATPSGTDMNTEFFIDLIPSGSVSGSRAFQLSHSVGFQLFGAGNIVIDPDRVFRLRSFVTGSLPSNVTGKLAYDSTLARPVWNNGSAWFPIPRLAADLPYDPSGSTLSATNVQDAIDELDAKTGGGGITVSGAYFKGATGDLNTASSSAFATKGMIWVPDADTYVTHIVAFIDAAATTENHHCQIASLDGTTTAALVVASLGTTATVASTTTNMRGYRFSFASPVLLTAGTPYLIAAVNASGIGTTALRLAVMADSGLSGWDLNAPGVTHSVILAYNTIDVTATQAADASNNASWHGIEIEGTTA
jgi:hypothetical protein